ncbi:unnamed protein product [Fraxinus pennsylvanica]|uniref:RRM domain-containing protein n=1 Tax=Fraxinus pennsylvanica TaxID=56036 RepID=A0AAD2E5G0_9LAMI|nr:unnamed protein product [Fraxinus pennsylvanica]
MSHFGRSGPPDIRDTFSLLVLNITFRTTADDLFPLFDKYGKVVDVFIPRDRSCEVIVNIVVDRLLMHFLLVAIETDALLVLMNGLVAVLYLGAVDVLCSQLPLVGMKLQCD